jgi:hypothetical protein
MLIFAVLLTGFSGIWGGTYMLVHSPGWLMVFPLWNIISGWILIGSLKGGSITEDNISDEKWSHSFEQLTVVSYVEPLPVFMLPGLPQAASFHMLHQVSSYPALSAALTDCTGQDTA